MKHSLDDTKFKVELTYNDVVNNKYNQSLAVDINSQLELDLYGDKRYEKIENGLQQINKNLTQIKQAISGVSQTIKSKK